MTKQFCFILLMSILGLTQASAQNAKQGTATPAKADVKFLEDITVESDPLPPPTSDPKAVFSTPQFSSKKIVATGSGSPSIENAGSLQIKYAQLLDMEVEMVQNLQLFKLVDDWMGTRYKLGGSTKEGIDCSALMQIFFTSLYGVTLPRTAREQFGFARHISRAELKEGDLIFFNTIGGVSHVGMYLQNNKFVHASSGGVTISDLYDEYWVKRFIGVGRVESTQALALSTRP